MMEKDGRYVSIYMCVCVQRLDNKLAFYFILDETDIIIITIIIKLLATIMVIKPIWCVIRQHVHAIRNKPNRINNICNKSKPYTSNHVNEDFGVLWHPSSNALLAAIRKNRIIMKRRQ